jgi:hypothetical protein
MEREIPLLTAMQSSSLVQPMITILPLLKILAVHAGLLSFFSRYWNRIQSPLPTPQPAKALTLVIMITLLHA